MLKVKLLHPDAKVPTRANATDAGLDLYADSSYIIPPRMSGVISTGVSMSIPIGYMANVRPRSGLAVKQNIDVLAGVIDSSYRGEIKVVLINHGISDFLINIGDRIAQLVIQRIELWTPEVVYELDVTSRGNNGFGSSGD